MPKTRSYLRRVGLASAACAVSAASATFLGQTDVAFVASLAAAGFLSLTTTAGLRYYSRGRL